MFFGPFKDIVPPSVLAGLLVWSGVNYLLIGPTIGGRIVLADYLPACTANVQAMAEQARDQELASLSLPSIDYQAEHALRQAEGLLNSPFMGWAAGASQGMADAFGLDVHGSLGAARQQYEAGKRAAGAAYETAQERIRSATAARLASADDLCACIAQTAIEESRTDWAIFTGTLMFYTPAPVDAFEVKMGAVARSGTCESNEGASR
ncbi:hypothetical protein [Aquamicrobium ahrensii]|uniref:Uncharacterized protein n=1 Tax=Aquamicrobium ahrensii TaxID=469551 RepID=A0ABV2KRZ6_9HYPH